MSLRIYAATFLSRKLCPSRIRGCWKHRQAKRFGCWMLGSYRPNARRLVWRHRSMIDDTTSANSLDEVSRRDAAGAVRCDDESARIVRHRAPSISWILTYHHLYYYKNTPLYVSLVPHYFYAHFHTVLFLAFKPLVRPCATSRDSSDGRGRARGYDG